MTTITFQVRRVSVISARPFADVIRSLSDSIGRPDLHNFHAAVVGAITATDLEKVVKSAVGSSGLMEFVRFDAGELLRKEPGQPEIRILRLIVGNPIIMKEMVKTVPDAAAYAPVTILIDQRADGVHISYDSMASLISHYGSEAALAVAEDLDSKIQTLISCVAE